MSTSKGSFIYYLREFHRTHLHPNLAFKLVYGDSGLQVVAQKDDIHSLTVQLVGKVRLIPAAIVTAQNPRRLIDDLFEELSPSFLDVEGKKAVMWGPLALAKRDLSITGRKHSFRAGLGAGAIIQGKDYPFEIQGVESCPGITTGNPIRVFYGPIVGDNHETVGATSAEKPRTFRVDYGISKSQVGSTVTIEVRDLRCRDGWSGKFGTGVKHASFKIDVDVDCAEDAAVSWQVNSNNES
jgi:hypothetical protein